MHWPRDKTKFQIILFSVLLVLLSVLTGCTAQKPSGRKMQSRSESIVLPPDDYSNELLLYRDFSLLTFENENESLRLKNANPGVLVLLYWTSWSSYCQNNVARYDTLAEVAAADGARFVLVNKLDGGRETRDSAESFLREANVQAENWFDDGLASYQALGLNTVPSLLVFDGNNRLMGIREGEFPTDDALRSMIRNAAEGNENRLLDVVKNTLLNQDGGIQMGSAEGVLSESQGLIMLAAGNAGDEDLYKKALGYVEKNKTGAGLVAWNTGSSVNALVDDLRIYRAMTLYGADADRLGQYADAIYNFNVNNGRLVDFYDAAQGQQAKRLTLCYADFETLALLAAQDERWGEVYENALMLVEGGRISDELPLYHGWYDYKNGKYKSDELHMAEAMLTLLHLSRVGRLPSDAVVWLEERMREGYLYAVYDIDGNPSRNGNFESTAIYAIMANIGLSEGRLGLVLRAITRMEALRVHDVNSRVDAAFANADGSGLFSFNQLTALLIYQNLKEYQL